MSTTLASPTTKTKVLYQANWSHGTAGWRQGGAGTWYAAGGALIGTHNGNDQFGSVLIAPYHVTGSTYSVVASVRRVGWQGKYNNGFGVLVRANGVPNVQTNDNCIIGGILRLDSSLPSQASIFTLGGGAADIYNGSPDFNPGTGWHTVQVKVKGNKITLLIDGSEAMHASSNFGFANKGVGLFVNSAQVQVRSFRVLSK
jgi:hypothetical protein